MLNSFGDCSNVINLTGHSYTYILLFYVSVPAFTSFVPHRYCLIWVTAILSQGWALWWVPLGSMMSHILMHISVLLNMNPLRPLNFHSQLFEGSNKISIFCAKGKRWHECWAHEGALTATVLTSHKLKFS